LLNHEGLIVAYITSVPGLRKIGSYETGLRGSAAPPITNPPPWIHT
jgi:hypothetical protein